MSLTPYNGLLSVPPLTQTRAHAPLVSLAWRDPLSAWLRKEPEPRMHAHTHTLYIFISTHKQPHTNWSNDLDCTRQPWHLDCTRQPCVCVCVQCKGDSQHLPLKSLQCSDSPKEERERVIDWQREREREREKAQERGIGPSSDHHGNPARLIARQQGVCEQGCSWM